MTSEIDAAGALIDAGLVAGAIEARPGQGAKARASHDAACRNCGAALHGAFCQACGQGAHIHSSLLHLGEELLHGLFHFDAKGWRTLPLLVARPGQLTRRYVEGQRVRFVSPLALFLFMMFLLFLVASLTSGGSTAGANANIAKARLELEAEVSKNEAQLDRARAQLERATAAGGDVDDAREAVADAQGELTAARLAVDAIRASATAAADASASAAARTAPDGAAEVVPGSRTRAPSGVATGPSPGKASAPSAAAASANVPAPAAVAATPHVPGWARTLRRHAGKLGWKGVDEAVARATANPELTAYELKGTASKYTFMLVPLSLPFLWLMFFWRRGVTMFDHAIFALYSLSFMALLFVVLMLLGAAGLDAPLPWLAVAVPPLHMAAQLQGTYRLGVWSTLWRTAALVVVAAVVLGLYLLLILALTVG